VKPYYSLPLASPSLGIAHYEEIREKRLAFSPSAKLNFEKFNRSSRRSENPDYRPTKIDIEPASRCNFRCQMCVVSTWDKGRRAEDLTFSHFKHLVDAEPQVLEIKLQGLGEPLLVGDSLFEMIKYASSQFIWVRTVTNASLLHKNDNVEKLLSSNIGEIQVSIDGAKEETMEKIRKGSHANRVFANVKLLNARSRELDYQCTKMWTVVQKDNIDELELLVHLASELGFPNQCFSLDMHGWGINDWVEMNNDREVETGLLSEERLLDLVKLGNDLGVKVEFWSNSSKYSTASLQSLCPWPFERYMVSSDMRVTPCCMISNPDVLELGKSLDYKVVWDSDSYKQFRNAHLKGAIPRACRMCYET
jgi:MoaA/NifB/PqqE/SkfB family radical SAM enzyme